MERARRCLTSRDSWHLSRDMVGTRLCRRWCPMSLAELVIVSVVVEGRSKSEVARDYKVSRYWVQQLVRRYELEGEAAFVPRSRRPHHNPWAIGLDLEDQIVRLRKELS